MCYMKLVVCSILFTLGKAWFNDPEKVRLEDVKALTLYRDQWTTGRRNPPIPQLKCVGGSAAHSGYIPDVVQCRNMGSDGFYPQWECKAEMNNCYRFGRIQVNCEGYDNRYDAFILKGSCGLEYTLEYTDSGNKGKSNHYHYHCHGDKPKSWFWGKFLLSLAVVAIFCHKIRRWCRDIKDRLLSHFFDNRHSRSSRFQQRRGSRSQSQQDKTCSGNRFDSPPSYDDTMSNTDSTNEETRTTDNQPYGFWSGLGFGTLIGYFIRARTYWREQDWGFRDSRTRHDNGERCGSDWTSSWCDDSSPCDSSSTYTSTGYGDTSLR